MSYFTEMPANHPQDILVRMAEETLQFEYQVGDVTPVAYPYTTGWRTLPALLVMYLDATANLHIQNQSSQKLQTNRVYTIPPGIHHRIDMTNRGKGYSYWVHVNFTICSTVQIVSLLQPSSATHIKNAEKIRRINQELVSLAQNKTLTLQQVFRRKALAFELLLLITENFSLRPGTLEYLRKIEKIAPALTYIKKNLSQHIDQRVLAKTISLSPSRFHSVFLEALGEPPGRYIQGLRLQRARQLLPISQTVGEAAQASGYPDLFHFSRLFKKHFGMSPMAYRKQGAPKL